MTLSKVLLEVDEMIEKINPGDIDGISLIGFRINPDSDKPDLYSLFTYGAKELPLVINTQIIFFNSLELVNIAYSYFNEDIKKISSPPSSTLDAVCDIAEMLHILNHESFDESATIVNCLNIVFDLVTASQIVMPTRYKKNLFAFADHLTFNQEFVTYLDTKKLSRKDITNAFLWCIGAITVKSKIITL